ncbi:MAG TPA: polysaccharide biosynthesis tyrosine autokinase [Blastocatellia bacterium]|nr:polysaccharide biosynthesis tyrosine autokinase [Blastocatellia bacterium]
MADERVELEKIPLSEDAPLVRPGYPRMPGYAETGYGYGYGEEEDRAHLRELWRTIRKHKWLIITIVVVVTSIVTVEAYRAKPVYSSTSIIELGKENTTMVKSTAGDLVIQTDDTDLYYPEMSIKTKMLKLMSEPLLEDVVVGLNLDKNSKFSDVGRKTSYWEALQTLGGRLSGQKQEEPARTVIQSSPMESSSDIARTPEDSERLAPYVGIIAGGLEVEQIKDTRALKVTYTHTDPDISAAIANGVAQTFIDSSFRSRTEKFTNASDWLDRTTRELKAKVQQAEQALADYTRSHNIFSTEGKETLTTEKLSRLHEQATRAETERILKQSVYEEVKAGRAAQLPAAFQDQKIAGLRVKLDELQAQSDRLNMKYGPDNPMVIDIKQQVLTTESQIEASRKALEEKLKSEYELAMRDETSLKSALNLAKGEAVQQNQDAIQYNILKQEVETNKQMYQDFLQKTNQAKVEVAQQHNNLRLIQPARVPRAPVGPGRFRTILFGLLLSFAGGIGLAFVLEYLDNSIKSVEDVGRYVRLPALGVIPAISANTARRVGKQESKGMISGNEAGHAANDPTSRNLMALDNRSAAAEAYRVLRTSMLLSAADRPPKIVLVTSGQAGEGKTTTVVNTAISLGQLGASVLIIDCDLRKPATHKLLNVEHQNGVSTYLSRETEINGLIRKLPIGNLSLLPCGPIPPNPAELLSSNKMKNMLALLSESYDHILIDSPPLLSVTDSVILSTMVDGVILVVHGGKSTRIAARRARQELTSVGAKIFGVVLNNLDVSRDGYDYTYYTGRTYGTTETTS